jgi:ABC-2 type transport system permease protein
MTLTRFSWRQIWRGTVIWSVVSAIIVLTAVQTYESAYGSEAARASFARSVGRLPALQALYGRATGVDSVGGFVTWRYGDVVTLVVALWALLAVTRILRGDEESGRAELLVAGRVSPRRLLTSQLVTVLAACALVAAVVALAGMGAGLATGGSLLFGFMVAGGGVLFGAIAAFTSQLFDTRRRAAGWAGACLGASYLLRALADGSTDLHWLAWLTPLGWAERIEPFTGASFAPVLLVVASSLGLAAVAVELRGLRDTGAGLVVSRAGRGRMRTIGSALRLDWQLSARALMAWASGILVLLFVLGYLTHDMARFAHENPTIDEQIKQIYGYSMTSPEGFLSLAFSTVALVLAVYAGTQMLSAREEETEGRADTMLVRGTSRVRWLGSRVAIAMTAMAVLALVAAIGAWVGAQVSGEPITVADTLAASFNVVPAALLFGGLSVLAFGAVPRVTAYVAFGGAGAAFVIQLLAGLAGAPSWLGDLSPFSHLAAVPAVPVNTAATLVMLAVAVASTAAGMAAFRRRDLLVD